METYQNMSEQWLAELERLSPELQRVIIRLNDDSQMLRLTFDLDFFTPAELSGLIGASLLRSAAHVALHYTAEPDDYDRMLLLHDKMTSAVRYMERRQLSLNG